MKFILLTLATIFSSLNFSNAKVYFINVNDGDQLKSPFLLQIELSGKGISTAGVDRKNNGEHHRRMSVDEINVEVNNQ